MFKDEDDCGLAEVNGVSLFEAANMARNKAFIKFNTAMERCEKACARLKRG